MSALRVWLNAIEVGVLEHFDDESEQIINERVESLKERVHVIFSIQINLVKYPSFLLSKCLILPFFIFVVNNIKYFLLKIN